MPDIGGIDIPPAEVLWLGPLSAAIVVRVGVLTTSYPRWPGDPAGPFVAALNRQLLARGHRVEVLAAGPAGPCTPRDDDAHIPVERVPSRLFYDGGAPDALGRGPTAAWEAARFSLALAARLHGWGRRMDAFVSHWLVPCGALAHAWAGDRPHVAIAHSSDVHLLRRLRLTAIAGPIARRAHLVYTSESLRIPGAPGVVAPMGIDCAAFAATDDDRHQARTQVGARTPAILFLGRFVPVKGLDLLLRAVSQLPGVELWLGGDGPLAPRLRQAAQSPALAGRVQFLGVLDAAARRQRLLACDVVAVPSLRLPDGRTEGAPQVVLEALAAGCPLVVSQVGGIPELLGQAGWLVADADPEAWATTLATALSAATATPDAAVRRLRDAATAQAARFDWARLAPQILGPLWHPAPMPQADPAAPAAPLPDR